MPLFWFAFFQGFAVVVLRVVLGDRLDVQVDLLSMCLGVGIVLPLGRPDAANGRHLAVPRTHALISAIAALAAAVMLGIGDVLPAFALLAVGALAMLAFGRGLTPLLLYIGVQKVKRLHLLAALLSGGACAYALARFVLEPHLGPALAVTAGVVPAFALSMHRAVRAADMPEPQRESPRTGLSSVLGALLVGMGIAALYRCAAVRSAVSFSELRAQSAFFAWPLAMLALGAWVLPLKNPRSRRAALLLGTGALFAVAAYGFELFYLGDISTGPERAAFLARIGVTDTSGLADEARLGLALLGAPSFLIGTGLVVIARLYAGLPMGRKLVRHLPISERRALSGAPVRAAAFVLGIPVADALIARGRLGQHGALVLLATGGLALLLSDPRAGVGRKLGLGLVAGVLGFLGLWLAW